MKCPYNFIVFIKVLKLEKLTIFLKFSLPTVKHHCYIIPLHIYIILWTLKKLMAVLIPLVYNKDFFKFHSIIHLTLKKLTFF